MPPTDINLKIMETLLIVGLNPNLTDDNGRSLLNQAIRRENESLVSLLLTHGADVNMQGNMKKASDNANILAILLQNGGNVNSPDKPVLHSTNPQALLFLARNGCDINIKADNGATPVEHALEGLKPALEPVVYNRWRSYNPLPRSALGPLGKLAPILAMGASWSDVEESKFPSTFWKRFENKLLYYFQRTVIDVILKSGYKLKHFSAHEKHGDEELANFKKIQETFFSQPLTLFRQAANTVRTNLKPNAIHAVRILSTNQNGQPAVIPPIVAKEIVFGVDRDDFDFYKD